VIVSFAMGSQSYENSDYQIPFNQILSLNEATKVMDQNTTWQDPEHYLASSSTASHATAWQDALPIGSGLCGCLWFGNVVLDQVIYSSSSCWLPSPSRSVSAPDLRALLEPARKLMSEGRAAEAEKLYLKSCQEAGMPYVGTDTCHPAARLLIHQDTPCHVIGYRRTFHAQQGYAEVSWKDESGHSWQREAFVSRASHIAYMRWRPPKDQTLSLRARMDACDSHNSTVWQASTYPPLQDGDWGGGRVKVEDLAAISLNCKDGTLIVEGKYRHGPGGWCTVGSLFSDGTIEEVDGELAVANASYCEFRVLTTTSSEGAAPEPDVARDIVLSAPSYDEARAKHISEHRELYDRVSLRLGGTVDPSTSEVLLARAADGLVPTQLWQNIWAVGRSLFIQSTHAEGRFPPHLQGLWTGTWNPPWFGCYTNDENVQMMHWQVVGGSLQDLAHPFFQLLKNSLSQWHDNARQLYGCNGLLAPLQQGGTWARSDQAEWVGWTGGAGWLALEAVAMWEAKPEQCTLEEVIAPLLQGVLDFYCDFLTLGDDGLLHVCSSISVQNNPIGWGSRWTVDSTMDFAIIRSVVRAYFRILD